MISGSIEDLKRRIHTQHLCIEAQSEAFVKGYIHAMQDNGNLLSDIDFSELDYHYRAELYERAMSKLTL